MSTQLQLAAGPRSGTPIEIGLFGAAPDTGNLGVSALCHATLHGIQKTLPYSTVTVFDHTRGIRSDISRLGANSVHFTRAGAFHTRRLYLPESLTLIRVAGWLGGVGNLRVPLIKRSAAIFDISGGDSFTDIYGSWRFRAVTLPKLIAIEQRTPLVLLPQTYGPFKTASARRVAAGIVQRAAAAWARDERSFGVLRDLLGDHFDPRRHKSGVDVAFALPSQQPSTLPESVSRWIRDRECPVAGLNVSGLIYNDDRNGTAFGFRASYRDAIRRIAKRLTETSSSRLLLVPHVVTPRGHYESDLQACEDVLESLGREAKGRVLVLPALSNPSEIKWVIAQLDWFCGTRMHSTIAGLSSGVPTVGIAYSPKTVGVFETCGQGQHVVDPCVLSTDGLVEAVYQTYENRDATRTILAQTSAGLVGRALRQFVDIGRQIGCIQ